MQGERTSRETRSLCAYGTRCPSLASGHRRRGALVVHIGRLSDVYTAHPPSRAIGLVETRCLRSRCLKPFFRRWTVLPLLCSRRPHRTFIPLSPSCRAISQVETRSLCAHGSRCPSLASGRRRSCALAAQIRRLYRALAIVQVETRSKRSWFSMPSLASDRRRRCALAVHIGRLLTALAIVQGDRTSRDALLLRSWFSMPFFGVGTPPLL